MSDFHQGGAVATLHRLNPDGLRRLEHELVDVVADHPIGLVLPALYSEFETPAMHRIRAELAQVRYLRRIVVALDRASEAQYEAAEDFFYRFPTPVTILWIDGPPMQALLEMLEQRGLSPGPNGKGRACWLAFGYALACGDCEIFALHDCDIVNYERQLLGRLCYPVANPNLGFEFSKGYYARVTDRMNGRVTRLFVTPLVRSLQGMAGPAPFLDFLSSFRYPLAGEFAMKTNLARVNRIPADWGLEIGALAEVFRNCATSRVCQVDIADNYEHKHQILSADDAGKGLRRMALDIAKCLFRTMAGEGLVFTRDHFCSLEVRYIRLAEDSINRYYADAQLNGLQFDRHAEEEAVATFANSLRQAAKEFCTSPLGSLQIPSWNRVTSAIPDFLHQLVGAVASTSRSAMVGAA